MELGNFSPPTQGCASVLSEEEKAHITGTPLFFRHRRRGFLFCSPLGQSHQYLQTLEEIHIYEFFPLPGRSTIAAPNWGLSAKTNYNMDDN
jgi:hypothetical protein